MFWRKKNQTSDQSKNFIPVETNIIICKNGVPISLNGNLVKEGDLDFLEKGEGVNGGKVGQVNNYQIDIEL